MPGFETTMTRKGQVTIPAKIRIRLGLKPHDRVRFEIEGDEVKIKPSPSRLLAGYGAVKPKARPEDWGQIRDQIAHAIAEEVAQED